VLLAVLLLLLLLPTGGCRKGSGAQDDGQSEGQDGLPLVSLACVVSKPPASMRMWERERARIFVSRSGEVIVGTGAVVFSASIEPQPDEEWVKENVKVEGPGQVEISCSEGRLRCSFPEGPPGETMTLTITGVDLPHSDEDALVLSMKRVAEPTVVLEVNVDGEWRQVSTSDCLGDPPLRLRARFSKDMDRDSVETILEGLGTDITWTDDRTAEFTLPSGPPSLVRVNLWDAQDTSGLKVLATIWRLYTGDPPQLYAFDPETGEETSLCRLPADVYAAAVSPDGRTVLHIHYHERSWEKRALLVRVNDGTSRALDAAYGYHPAWLGGQHLLRLHRGERPDLSYQVITTEEVVVHEGALPWGLNFRAVSPDGKHLSGLVIEHPADVRMSGDGWFAAGHLVIVNLETGEHRLFSDFVSKYEEVGTCLLEGLAEGPFWSPDGRKLAAVSDLGPERGCTLLVLDVASGTVDAEVPIASQQNWAGSWSPDGLYWTVGSLLLETAPPHSIADLGMACGRKPEWSPDAKWFAINTQHDGWGETVVFRVDPASGPVKEKSLGTVFPCGWDAAGRFYFIRWPAFEFRFEPSVGTTGYD